MAVVWCKIKSCLLYIFYRERSDTQSSRLIVNNTYVVGIVLSDERKELKINPQAWNWEKITITRDRRYSMYIPFFIFNLHSSSFLLSHRRFQPATYHGRSKFAPSHPLGGYMLKVSPASEDFSPMKMSVRNNNAVGATWSFQHSNHDDPLGDGDTR